ncbi:hypothetical protein ACC722_39190, partial [Rhizobium ruizarguesonis]
VAPKVAGESDAGKQYGGDDGALDDQTAGISGSLRNRGFGDRRFRDRHGGRLSGRCPGGFLGQDLLGLLRTFENLPVG